MPEFKTPIDEDENLFPKVKMYEDAVRDVPPFAGPPDPALNPVPDVAYDTEGFPQLPRDLTAVTSVQLGQLFHAVEAWHEHLNYMLTECDAETLAAKEIRDLTKAHVKEELKKAGVNAKERDESFRLDPRFVLANSEYVKNRVYSDRVEAAKDRLSKRFQLISREITRRGEDFKYGGDSRFNTPTDHRRRKYGTDYGGEEGEAQEDRFQGRRL